MINILLDNNIIIDFLSEYRLNKFKSSRQLYDLFAAKTPSINYFISSSSLDNLEFVLLHELKKNLQRTNKEILKLIHLSIKDLFARGFKLAKTPSYIDIDYEDIEDSQVIASAIAIDARVITRDEKMLKKYNGIAITVEEFLEQYQNQEKYPQIDFANLKKQYFHLQTKVEQQMDEVLNTTSFIMGKKIGQLETALEQFTQARHAISCSSGTDALILAMMALDIQPGDEIITTPFTFIATAETIALMGAKPVFVDIEADTLNLDAAKIEAAITEKTKAIMPVSLYGQPCDMDAINAIAKKYQLKVIIDGAQSFGATYKNKMEVHHCDIYITSFFPAKPLGCYGDGGAVFTNNNNYAKKIKMLRVHGQNQRYQHQYIGMGGRMDTLQAAVLLAKLPNYTKEIEQRQQIAKFYHSALQSCHSSLKIQRLTIKPDRTSVWAQYTIRVNNRDALQERLKGQGIPSAVHYPMPLHKQACFQYLEQARHHFPEAEKASEEVLSLPMNPWILKTEVDRIASTICLN